MKIEVKLIASSLINILLLVSCNNENTENITEETTYSITVGVYILNGTEYIDQNKDFIFLTQEECRFWSRTAQADTHSTVSHEHYNAAKNTTYNSNTQMITWVEYGPEIDQNSIDITCANGSNGVTKTVNKVSYTADKNFFLKIKSVVEK